MRESLRSRRCERRLWHTSLRVKGPKRALNVCYSNFRRAKHALQVLPALVGSGEPTEHAQTSHMYAEVKGRERGPLACIGS